MQNVDLANQHVMVDLTAAALGAGLMKTYVNVYQNQLQ